MDEAYELADYLPLSYKTLAEQEYVAFLWDVFETNYTYGKYQFAFLAYHMLTMTSVYFNIWQIKKNAPENFQMALVGADSATEKLLLEATSPFAFSKVKERSILRFLKLIQCDNSKIGTYAKLVDDRNETAHPNGNIFFSDEVELGKKVREVLRVVREIEKHSQPIIERCYQDFLLNSYDPDDREYTDHTDQIREVLIHSNYMSQCDIDMCAEFDITTLATESAFLQIEELHETLKTGFATVSDDPTVVTA